MKEYIDFLKSKIVIAPDSGIEIDPSEVNPILKPHQRDSVLWAVKGGRRALFESFGLGKTVIQLEIVRLIISKIGGRALIVCPLGVKGEFKHDAEKLLGIKIQYVKTMQDCVDAEESIMITNYERVRDGDIDPKFFTVTSLDEAAVLRSFGSKTYQEFLLKFQGVKYKYVCTATPSPNKFKELIHYAGYLEIMDTGQALTRFFKRDSTHANNLTLHPHKEKEFFFWLSTWALFVTKPSDLNPAYSDEGYNLPPMKVIYHEVEVDHASAGYDRDGQGFLMREASMGLKQASKEKQDSKSTRIDKMMEIINQSPDDHFIIWHDLEVERHMIKKALPEACEVYGSLDMDIREQRTIDFSEGREKYFVSKESISGCGSNFQYHCHKAIFLGINYKFHGLIQAIHRIYRFLQSNEVEIHIIYTESEQAILTELKRKWIQHDQLVEKMIVIIKEYGLASTNIEEKLARTIGIKRQEKKETRYRAINNDSILEVADWPDNSIDMYLTSIPFGNHYEYSASYNDLGHNTDNDAFFEQMDFLAPHLLRTLRPGRVFACHVKDRILFGNATGTGMPTVDPFHMLTTMHYIKHGFQFMGMVTVVTDVVRENAQTYRLGWTENSKDGTKMGVGCPEYILLFRKLPTDTGRAYADVPVIKSKTEYSRARWQIDAHAFWRSSGDRLLIRQEMRDTPISDLQARYREWSRKELYDYEDHVKLAEELEEDEHLPAGFMVVAPGSHDPNVWDDVNRMITLNSEQARKDLIYHICPLQIDIVERLIRRYTNKGEIVADPFAGIMTVPYVAVKMERQGWGVELSTSYWHDGLPYLETVEEEVAAPTLFELMQAEENA